MVALRYNKVKSNLPSPVYNLDPLGQGTYLIESLTSYIIRLAAAHRIKTGDLFSEILFPHLNHHYMNNIVVNGGNGFYDWGHMINGLSTSANEFALMVGKLTGMNSLGNDLTLLRFKDILPNRGLLRTNQAWCPACLQEMSPNMLYLPLIWNLKSYTTCLQHNSCLVDTCPECSRHNLTIERRSVLGFCNHCSSWLGSEIVQDANDHWEYKKSIMMADLLYTLSTYEKLNISKSLYALVNNFTNSNITEFAKRMDVPKSTFWTWYHGKNLPTLEDIMRVCNKFGIGISNFYANKLNIEYSPIIAVKRKQKVNVNKTELNLIDIGRIVKKVVSNKNRCNLTVLELSRISRCNKKTLYKYYGKLCKLQSAQNKAYIRMQKDSRINAINFEVDFMYCSILDLGINPTKRKIEGVLQRPAVFKEAIIRKQYNDIMVNHD